MEESVLSVQKRERMKSSRRSFSQSFAFIRQNERVLRLLLNLLLLLLLRLSFPQPIPYARIHSSTPHRPALSSSRELSLKSTFKVFRFQSACALPRLLGSFTGLSPRERVRERRERERERRKRSSSQDRAASNSILSVIGSDALAAPLAFSPFRSAVGFRRIRWIFPPKPLRRLRRF